MNKIIYKGKIRDGKPDSLSTTDYEVIYESDKLYARLDPFPKIDYNTDAYRKMVNNTELVDDYFIEHDKQQPGYFKYIAPHLKRGDVIADCGCGGGSMLDLIKGMAGKTIAVEPFFGYHESLTERQHIPYSSITDALNDHSGKVDLALSIHVIEHTDDPLIYLTEIYKLLKPNGKAIVFTPNLDDVLLKIHPEAYAPFFYRTVHNYYFSGDSLELLGKKAGFKTASKFYYQEFGLGNTVGWLKHNKAKGNLAVDGINTEFDANWKKYLEESGQAYNVGVVLEK